VTAVVNILMQRNTTKTNITIKSQRRSTLRKMIEPALRDYLKNPYSCLKFIQLVNFGVKKEHLSSAYPGFQFFLNGY